MGTTLVTFKVMPDSPETDLEKLKESLTKIAESNQGKNINFDEQPVAFGLKALMTSFAIPEDKELDPVENAISETEHVSSVQITDMRRAIE